MIFPFINQMIEELGITDNPDRVGFYSGLVVSLSRTKGEYALR